MNPADNDYSAKWPCFWVAALSAFMSTLDSSIVNVALPTLAREFSADVQVVTWVVQAYLLTATAFLLIGGRLLDLWGERRVFQIGFALFTAGSILCSLSVSIYMLIVSRAFQGIGAAVLMSSNQGLIGRAFPPAQRGRMLGMTGTFVSIGLACGPPLGGFLIGVFGWRSIFYINIPIGVAAVIYSGMVLKKRTLLCRENGFDWQGAVLIVTGLFSLFLGLHLGVSHGFTGSKSILLISASLVLLVFFLFNESRSPFPILDLALFRNRFFTQSCAAGWLAFFSIIPAIILFPFYLQNVRGFNPEEVGLILLTMPAVMLLIAPVGGWISDLAGTRFPATAGLVIVGSGLLLLSRLGTESSCSQIVWRLALIGVGMGFFGSPNTNAILSSVQSRSMGAASGISALMRTSGIAFGTAFMTTLFTSFRNSAADQVARLGLEGIERERILYLEGIKPVFIVAAAIVALNIVNSITRGRNP